MATRRKDPSINIKERAPWTKAARRLLAVVEEILDEERSSWPLTLRQLHYALVEHPDFEWENSKSNYQGLSRRMTQARLEGKIEWEALEDRTREAELNGGFQDRHEYVKQEVDGFLEYYGRDLQQSQPVVVEVWVEKDALSRVMNNAAQPYNVPVVVARGYSSISFLNEARERINSRHRRTKILYFGDMDPSGWHMLPRMMHTLQDEMDVGDAVEAKRCALTMDLIRQRKLPTNPDAIKDEAWALAHGKKKGDPRVAEYVRHFGRVAVELDAIRPGPLTQLVREHIEANIDMDLFREEERKERADIKAITALRGTVMVEINKAVKRWKP